MNNGPANRHHYVPQFYLRRFACTDNARQLRVIEQHGDAIIADLKSIKGIGYEDALHNYSEDGTPASIEDELNVGIETPFAASPTWLKISSGSCATVTEDDKLPIYGFARHLQQRNVEFLRFIETENLRFQAGEFSAELTEEERTMHAWIAAAEGRSHTLFRAGALDGTLPVDSADINVMVCRSPIALRSSTNPTLWISDPGHPSAFGSFFDSLRTWWLTLDRDWGAFIIAGGPSGFTNAELPVDAARVINRQYLVQLLNSPYVRYLIADDEFLPEDLAWAGYRFDQHTTHGFRYRK